MVEHAVQALHTETCAMRAFETDLTAEREAELLCMFAMRHY
jgi:hypothetical protein